MSTYRTLDKASAPRVDLKGGQMKLSDYFRNVRGGEWNQTAGKLSWRITDDVMYFECSHGEEDWQRNFDLLPALIFIRGNPIITQRGWAKVWKDLQPILAENQVSHFIGYSHGGIPATLASWHTGTPAIVFGCPNVAVITRRIRETFEPVWNITTARDIVQKSPPWLGKWATKTVLPYVYAPDRISHDAKLMAQWITGHTPDEYELSLKIMEAEDEILSGRI
jgi:hypothetical protein